MEDPGGFQEGAPPDRQRVCGDGERGSASGFELTTRALVSWQQSAADRQCDDQWSDYEVEVEFARILGVRFESNSFNLPLGQFLEARYELVRKDNIATLDGNYWWNSFL